jgi:flagellar biosynthesis/type III secretory pathway chaperone
MDKFVTPGVMPTAYESELLIILMEECAEVQQRASKALRFGLDEIQDGQAYDNVQRLSFEVGDLIAVITSCNELNLINDDIVRDQHSTKLAKLEKYMQQDQPK